jgi:hypothetical protein
VTVYWLLHPVLHSYFQPESLVLFCSLLHGLSLQFVMCFFLSVWFCFSVSALHISPSSFLCLSLLLFSCLLVSLGFRHWVFLIRKSLPPTLTSLYPLPSLLCSHCHLHPGRVEEVTEGGQLHTSEFCPSHYPEQSLGKGQPLWL